MTSFEIYNSNKTNSFKIKWNRIPKTETEWEFFDITKPENMMNIINEFFSGDILHVYIGRKDSYSVEKSKLYDKIKYILSQRDFIIWNENFTMAIELNELGAYRTGKIGF